MFGSVHGYETPSSGGVTLGPTGAGWAELVCVTWEPWGSQRSLRAGTRRRSSGNCPGLNPPGGLWPVLFCLPHHGPVAQAPLRASPRSLTPFPRPGWSRAAADSWSQEGGRRQGWGRRRRPHRGSRAGGESTPPGSSGGEPWPPRYYQPSQRFLKLWPLECKQQCKSHLVKTHTCHL